MQRPVARTGSLSRRRLLRGAAGVLVAGASATLYSRLPAAASSERIRRSADVAVVGAGISGLTAAWRLTQAGASVIVLEARDRVGGRMVRQEVEGGAYVDLGGQWVGPTQDRILALAGELGVQRFPWYHEGDTVLVYGETTGRFHGDFPPFSGDPPPLPHDQVADADAAWTQLEEIAATVPPDAPWTAPDASTLDHQTLGDWLSQNTKYDFARFVFAQAARIGGGGAFEPDEVSMLHMAYTQSSGPQSEGPETDLFDGAAGQIPPLLAGMLGDCIELGAAVWRIEQDDSGVVLSTDRGRYAAQAVIVAIPPTLAGGIQYDPPVPQQRLQLTQRLPMGSLIKVHALYPTAFWRDAGLSGVGTGDLRAAQFTADSSPESGSPGLLTSFIAGTQAVALGLATAQQRQDAVLADFVIFFGDDASQPDQFIEKNWDAAPWTGGAFTAFLGPGVWTTYGEALRAPVGRIFWAGTECATRWSGYFDGGVRAGEDAASAALAAREPPASRRVVRCRRALSHSMLCLATSPRTISTFVKKLGAAVRAPAIRVARRG
jgi:monoamine oxidase